MTTKTEHTGMPSGIAKRKPINMSAFAGTPRPDKAAPAPPPEEQHEEDAGRPDNQVEPKQPPEWPGYVPLGNATQGEEASVASAFARMAEVLDRLEDVERVSLSIPVSGSSERPEVLTLELTCARVQVLADCVNMLYDTSTSMPRIPYGVQMMLKTAVGGEVSVMSLGHSFQFEGTNWQLMSFVVTGPADS
jgi:hypothetical protein